MENYSLEQGGENLLVEVTLRPDIEGRDEVAVANGQIKLVRTGDYIYRLQSHPF